MRRYWLLGVLFCLAGSTALAQDPVKIDPKHNQVLLENDRVRVLKSWDNPGDKEATHSHPDYLVYAFGPFKRRFTFPDGTTKEAEMQAGQVMWQPAQTHSGENIGTTRTEVLLIELKTPSTTQKPAPKKPAAAKAPAKKSSQ